MPAEQRRRFRFERRPRRVEHRPDFKPDYLLAYLKDRGIHSTRQLLRSRVSGEPTVYDFQKAFGSWQAAVDQAFPAESIIGEPPTAPEYFIKVVLEFKITTAVQYRAARRRMPEAVPSFHALECVWGSLGRLLEAARRYPVKAIMDDYLRLWVKLRRTPTIEECDVAGVNLRRALDQMENFANKAALDAFMGRAIRAAARAAGLERAEPKPIYAPKLPAGQTVGSAFQHPEQNSASGIPTSPPLTPAASV